MVIYEAANHRGEADITATWTALINAAHGSSATATPYEMVYAKVQEMASRLNHSETTFSPTILVPLLEQYAVTYQNGVGPREWVPDLMIRCGVSFETLISIIQGMWYNNLQPFTGRHRVLLADQILFLCNQWYEHCLARNERIFGSDQTAQEINELLEVIGPSMDAQGQQDAEQLRRYIRRSFGV